MPPSTALSSCAKCLSMSVAHAVPLLLFRGNMATCAPATAPSFLPILNRRLHNKERAGGDPTSSRTRTFGRRFRRWAGGRSVRQRKMLGFCVFPPAEAPCTLVFDRFFRPSFVLSLAVHLFPHLPTPLPPPSCLGLVAFHLGDACICGDVGHLPWHGRQGCLLHPRFRRVGQHVLHPRLRVCALQPGRHGGPPPCRPRQVAVLHTLPTSGSARVPACRLYCALCVLPHGSWRRGEKGGATLSVLPLYPSPLWLTFYPCLPSDQHRTITPVGFQSDAWPIVFMLAMAVTNGYFGTLCMTYGPKCVVSS